MVRPDGGGGRTGRSRAGEEQIIRCPGGHRAPMSREGRRSRSRRPACRLRRSAGSTARAARRLTTGRPGMAAWRARHRFGHDGERHAAGRDRREVVRRSTVAHLMEVHGASRRRACAAMKAVAAERRRFGYRGTYVMSERQGIARLGTLPRDARPGSGRRSRSSRRPCGEEGLQVGPRGGRKRALGTRKPMVLPDGPDRRRSLDLVGDAVTDGRRLRLLAVVDDHARECLGPGRVRGRPRTGGGPMANHRVGQAATERLRRERRRTAPG